MAQLPLDKVPALALALEAPVRRGARVAFGVEELVGEGREWFGGLVAEGREWVGGRWGVVMGGILGFLDGVSGVGGRFFRWIGGALGGFFVGLKEEACKMIYVALIVGCIIFRDNWVFRFVIVVFVFVYVYRMF